MEGAIPENLRQLINSPDRPKGPPPHFHQFQTEYFRVESGVMGITVDGQVKRVTAEDGEVSVKAGSIHNFFIHPDSEESMTVYLSASDSGMDYQLDRIFFENWYGYWHDAMLHDGGLDWIQFLAVCLFFLALSPTSKLTLCKRSKMVETHTLPPPPGSLSAVRSATGPVLSSAAGLAAFSATSLSSRSTRPTGTLLWPR